MHNLVSYDNFHTATQVFFFFFSPFFRWKQAQTKNLAGSVSFNVRIIYFNLRDHSIELFFKAFSKHFSPHVCRGQSRPTVNKQPTSIPARVDLSLGWLQFPRKEMFVPAPCKKRILQKHAVLFMRRFPRRLFSILLRQWLCCWRDWVGPGRLFAVFWYHLRRHPDYRKGILCNMNMMTATAWHAQWLALKEARKWIP